MDAHLEREVRQAAIMWHGYHRAGRAAMGEIDLALWDAVEALLAQHDESVVTNRTR